jgi:sugar transferase EpsL
LIQMPQVNSFYRKYGKRLFDLTLTVSGLIALSPILACIAVFVRAKLGSPVLFRQVRPGIGGKPFTLYKFRTMTNARDAAGNLLPDWKRLSRFGCFLRSASIDELPELLNVLKGDMALVGPRPLLMEYLDRYTPEQARRHEVHPGITGWGQVKGRNALSWEKKFQLDVWYIDNMSLWLDLKILIMTLMMVFKREGINAEGHETMPKFMGTKNPENSHQP